MCRKTGSVSLAFPMLICSPRLCSGLRFRGTGADGYFDILFPMKATARGQTGGNKIPPGPFSIKESWPRKLLPAAAAAGLLFSAAFFFILPLSVPYASKAAVSLALGLLTADIFLFRQKLDHLRRHMNEAGFLGFSCLIKGNLWNPFSAPELLLEKSLGDPEEDRLLADLVCMQGPDYSCSSHPLARAENAAIVAVLAIALGLRTDHRLLPVLAPLFGLAALFYFASRALRFFRTSENLHAAGEGFRFMSYGADYRQWNFLILEAQRIKRGRIAEMELEIARVLLKEAGLSAGSRILEIGAGGGFLWKHLPQELKAGWTEAEKDPHAALYARRHGNGSDFRVSDVKKLPFKDRSFDAIVGLECFDSLTPEDLRTFLAEAARLLKPGGRLVHLKDFPDWPGGAIAERFNLFSLRALRRELVRICRFFFKFEEISPADAAALRSAVPKEPAVSRPYAKALADIYSAGARSDPRFSIPMFASIMALKEIFREAGFKILSENSELAGGSTAAIASFVAIKPAA